MPELKTAAFSHPVNIRTLPKKGQFVRYTAPVEVLVELAQDHDLIAVETFSGECLIAPWKRDGVKVAGKIVATVIQPCAVTGDPLQAVVEEEIEAILVPEGSRLSKPQINGEGELILDPMGDDPPDTFIGDSVDLATVWLEFFVLGLDPFARLVDAQFESGEFDEGRESPFSALAELKTTMKKQ